MFYNKRVLRWALAASLLTVAGVFPSPGAQAQEVAGSDAASATRADIAKTLGFVPRFFQRMADAAVSGMWTEMKGLQLNPNSALTGKTKELIGLGVSGQVPCRYCAYAHTEFAKLNGATSAELAEATAVAGLSRQFTAYTHGNRVDEATSRADLQRIVDQLKKSRTGTTSIQVVDATSARKDIESTFGFVPAFLARIPETALPGAWRELKELRLSKTSLSPKDKALIALAVASQVPSEPCIATETEFAKLAGASDKEVAEAVGMAAITRNMSTMLNGQMTDEKAFQSDIDKLVAGVKASQKAQLATKK
jgi:AhpD family alkylhydroperoxidase